jgi:acetylornithine deacetylase/succinyl-diaminopimelate desuccinylase-like protein
MAVRPALLAAIERRRDELIALCARLAATDSRNPPGDTRAIAAVCASFLAGVPSIELREVIGKPSIVNLVAIARGAGPGRRLVFNGHLDTGIVPDPASWTVPPFGGVVLDGRIYGRGVSDMKAGVAADLMTLAVLAEWRRDWAGEAVLTLVGDEGSGATWGTRYLLEHVPEVTGDALLSGDVGSPRLARCGEKGYLWLEIEATGKSAGGAHAHLGLNAIGRLVEALARLRALADEPAVIPEEVRAALAAAAPVSEALGAAGEADALTRVTVNVGTIAGGEAVNLVPARAQARLDIRFPPGVKQACILDRAEALLRGLAGISCRVIDGSDPTWTDPGGEFARMVTEAGASVLGRPPAMTLRCGFSDARLYRQRGIPAIVLGATARNGNAADEHVGADDLMAVFAIHALTAFEFLTLP